MNVPISQFPLNVLQHIFKIGVEQVWCLSAEYISQNPPVIIVDDEPFGYLFRSDKDRFEYHPNVLTLMHCAAVCKTWADAVIDRDFWDSLKLGMDIFDLTEPWKLGGRWNELFRDMPVHVLCSKDQAVTNIGKISTSVQRGRCNFTIYFPEKAFSGNDLPEAWYHLHSLLRYDCEHLKIVSTSAHSSSGPFGDRRIGLYSVMTLTWPRLLSLDVDNANDEIRNFRMIRRLSRYVTLPEDVVKARAPFPALKKLCLSGKLGFDIHKFVPLVAPRLEHLWVNITELEPYSVVEGSPTQMHKKRLLHEKFLEEDKAYRTFVTTFCMHAFKWPGPKTMNEHKKEWISRSSDIFIQTNVLIFEKREGKRCSLQLSVKEFFEVENLRKLHIPEAE